MQAPTWALASPINRQRCASVSCIPRVLMHPCLEVFVAFSIITTAASTIAPMAIAIPPSDMMFALMPWCCIGDEGDQNAQGE